MKAFLNYEYMITPGILKIISYIGAVIAVIAGLFTAFTADLFGGLAAVSYTHLTLPTILLV